MGMMQEKMKKKKKEGIETLGLDTSCKFSEKPSKEGLLNQDNELKSTLKGDRNVEEE